MRIPGTFFSELFFIIFTLFIPLIFSGCSGSSSSSSDEPVKTWGSAELIEGKDGDASDPQLAVNSSANAISVWEQHDGIRYNIYSNRFE